ncbi:hypothetical protein EVJ58_g8758 [Rhodofomes roseus]|uniref:Uncharacterized protein n=1 Tax=Rhodofomes roseus TaxID=34475 RepID=A0A4Y9Y177_9APHY|nr:hypothetical protein EVJ58_g8758 [Rhodofomes roseus]
MSSMRAPSPLSKVRSTEEGPHYPERSTSYSSSRSATLETAPPATPATGSPDEEEYTVRIAVDSRDHPEQLSPVIRESVLFVDDEEGTGHALMPGPMTSPLNIRKSPSASSPQPPPSPVRSDISSEISPRSFSFGVDDTEDSSRLSLDMSAGVEGIGLSLLQGFISGGANGDDDASILSSRSGANTPNRGASDRRHSFASTVNMDGRLADSPRSATQSLSHYSRSPSPAPSIQPLSPLEPPHELDPPNPPYARDSQRSSVQSLKSTRSLQSLRPSLAGSENSGGSGSGWEGDIYDDYRYSRFSMASKMSRFSQGSIKPMDIPPMPSDHPMSKLNVESRLRVSEDLNVDEEVAQPPAAVVVSSESGTITTELSTEEASERGNTTIKDKDRPSPLSFMGKDGGPNSLRHSNASAGQVASPLLHGSFGSPTQSVTPKTPGSPNTPASIDSFVSPPPGSPQQQVLSGLSPPRDMDMRRASGQAIVVEDDEEPPFVVGPSSPTSPRDQAAFASAKAREAAVERAMSPPNEPAPPPYAMAGPSSRPMQIVMSPPPAQGPPLLRTRSTNQPPADPAARTSLFMPHPHAPKPAQVPAGPMYGRQAAPFPLPQQYNGPPPGSAIHILHTLLGQQQQGRRPGGASTIYARFDRDLATSIGPVPISFTLEPQMNIPANRPVGPDMYNQGPGSRAGSPAAVPSRMGTPLDPSPYDVAATMAQGSSLSRSATASPAVGGLGRVASPAVGQNLARSATASPRPINSPPQPQGEFGRPDSVSSGKAIPRPNFFPKSGTPRPRSRSFSGFDSPIAEVVMPQGSE